MARISGTDLPNNKRAEVAICYIYGIGPTSAKKILDMAKVSYDTRAKDLTEEEVNKIQKVIDAQHLVEGDLRRQIIQNIRHKQSINTYQGFRHKVGLPVRGQRTRHNARTRRGKRRTVGTVRKDVAAKMGK